MLGKVWEGRMKADASCYDGTFHKAWWDSKKTAACDLEPSERTSWRSRDTVLTLAQEYPAEENVGVHLEGLGLVSKADVLLALIICVLGILAVLCVFCSNAPRFYSRKQTTCTMDTLGVEPRASRTLRGCDTTTPCAQCCSRILTAASIANKIFSKLLASWGVLLPDVSSSDSC